MNTVAPTTASEARVPAFDRFNPDDVVSVVPAFFLMSLSAEKAEEVALQTAMDLTIAVRAIFQAQYPADAQPYFAFRLCEESPTTELYEEEVDKLPKSLAGLTCDSGSDRSAAGLIRNIVDCNDLATIKQLAEGWLRQRMALHPAAPPIAHAEATGSEDAVDLLLHAFARAEVRGDHTCIRHEDIELAFQMATAQRPGQYQQFLAMHVASLGEEEPGFEGGLDLERANAEALAGIRQPRDQRS
jgi:hypothetical protein